MDEAVKDATRLQGQTMSPHLGFAVLSGLTSIFYINGLDYQYAVTLVDEEASLTQTNYRTEKGPGAEMNKISAVCGCFMRLFMWSLLFQPNSGSTATLKSSYFSKNMPFK